MTHTAQPPCKLRAAPRANDCLPQDNANWNADEQRQHPLHRKLVDEARATAMGQLLP